ncbi:transmembrane protein 19 isoform X2 [Condylostylus longicornis]|uniref:transmembrane protein 19 isoform X2 n=1 Tax=Condylostylus longicornis TaxID=2530218 RepID=UPI00244E3590|nr:transmembrane protein 19 isoform X2 [Condylostylus longicornis]
MIIPLLFIVICKTDYISKEAMSTETKEKLKKWPNDLMPVLICAMSIPLAMFMWVGNVTFLKLAGGSEYEAIAPTRWLFSTFAPLALMVYALRKKSVNKSGAILGLLVAITTSIASHAFFASLVLFFFTSSKATKFRSNLKRKFEDDFKEGGQRNWVQVLCNGGMATQLSLLYLLDCGSGERPINFSQFYRSSWLGIAILGSFACCNGDTWASELGSVLSKKDPYLITTRRRVPKGTNGGVSIIGLVVSFLGGLAVGIGYYLTILYTVDIKTLNTSPSQWPIVLFGGIAGLLGSVIDSILGATLQYSGIDENGKIVDKPNRNVRHISGIGILDNHSVNLISSILTAVIIPMLAIHCWPEI